MIYSFKNIERLRYRISGDIERIIGNENAIKENTGEQISSTIFATVFSALISEIAFSNAVGYWASFFRVFCFTALYIVVHLAYGKAYKSIKRKLFVKKNHTIENTINKYQRIQKNFDNIACDSILMARDCKNMFEQLPNDDANKNIRLFFYYEVIHYLHDASEKTNELVTNKSKCVRYMDKAEGVDAFRVINVFNIMEEINKFLEDMEAIVSSSVEDSQSLVAIAHQRNEIKGNIQNIKNIMFGCK